MDGARSTRFARPTGLQDAETMLREGLSIDLKNNRTEDAAADEHNLGVILRFEKRPAEAEAMLRRALAAHLQIVGAEHPSTAQDDESTGAETQVPSG